MKVAAWLLLLAACSDTPAPYFSDPIKAEVATFPAVPPRELDLLFVIDNSTSVSEWQNRLAAHTHVLFEQLAATPGGLPDLHVGVVTTDLGTMGSSDPANPAPPIGSSCAGSGDDGALQTSGAPITGAFIVDEDDGQGARTRNYTGELTDVLSQMLRVGSGGCEFEQPFHATRRALTNPANAGFVRADAQLAVVMLVDEDDCSFSDAALVDPATTALGPLESFRCTREGIACDQPIDEVGVKTHCHANEDSAYVEPMHETSAFLDGFKADRSMVSLGALAGTPEPVEIAFETPLGSDEMTLALAKSCRTDGSNGLSAANPGVRIRDLAGALDGRGAFSSICTDDLTPAMHAIARTITPAFGVTCLDTTRLADASTDAGVQPTCEVTVEHAGTATALPVCPDDGDCYELVADAVACPGTADHLRLVTRWATSPPAASYVRALCEPWPPR